MPQVAKNGIFTTGGGGFIYIGFVPGLRIGGIGYGGSTDNLSVANGLNTETLYSIGGGGLTIEYTVPFIKSIGVSPGLTIGGGNISVELYQHGVNNSWNGLGLQLGFA